MLPLCVLNNFYAEATNYKHPTRGSQTQRITLITSTHYTLHIYTPVGFALFCFVLLCFALFPIQGLCQFGSRSLSPHQNIPKAAETLKHQTQDQLDDNIASLMRQDPSQCYSHKELAKITVSLSHTLIATLILSDKHAAQCQQELTSAQRCIEKLEREAQERRHQAGPGHLFLD